jgi:hypothetical protein
MNISIPFLSLIYILDSFLSSGYSGPKIISPPPDDIYREGIFAITCTPPAPTLTL